MPSCAAKHCHNSYTKGFVMVRFPTNEKLREEWRLKVSREKWNPSIHHRLCEAHFQRSDWFKYRSILKPNSVPSLFCTCCFASHTRRLKVASPLSIDSDHAYCMKNPTPLTIQQPQENLSEHLYCKSSSLESLAIEKPNRINCKNHLPSCDMKKILSISLLPAATSCKTNTLEATIVSSLLQPANNQVQKLHKENSHPCNNLLVLQKKLQPHKKFMTVGRAEHACSSQTLNNIAVQRSSCSLKIVEVQSLNKSYQLSS